MGKLAVKTKHAWRGVAAFGILAAGCGSEAPLPSAIDNPGLEAEVRPDTPGNGLQFNFDPGDVVESAPSASGKFLVHFTRNGPNAVPAADADMSGTPDFVEQVAGVYDEVLSYYESLGFRPPRTDDGLPDNGGDGRFDVYLVDFAGIGDGTFQIDACDSLKKSQCAGYMVQENDYQGYGYPSTLVANRILGSHEFFHAIQASYDREQGSVFSEGTAVWATESFDPSLNDFEWFIDGYTNNTGRSLDVPLPGPVDAFSYGSGLFFQFLEERYGAGTVRALVERTEDGAFGETDPQWLGVTGKMLEAQAQTTFPEAFIEFATWNLFLGSKADPSRSYANCANYPLVKMEPVSAPYTDLLRLFYASAQYYRAFPNGRAKMTAALTSAESAMIETSDVTLLLVAERNGKYDSVVRVADVRAGAEEIDMTGADAFVTVAINTTTSGNSRRPTLCIGSPEEVAECKKSVEQTGTGGAGGAGGGGGAGGSGGGDPVTPDEPGSCGCRTVPSSSGAGIWALIAMLGLVCRRLRRPANCH
ncbi:MAG: hypothetical protein IPM54_26385 [Polyangiaceae bacterium]|nr:hypothetical protein [Polyangiaceae bacterium]